MRILILDGYNLIYRARYSGMNKGEHSVIFNFFRSLRPLVEKFNPDVAYMVLEGKPVKRLSIDPNYKGQRVYHNDDNFNEQRKSIISILEKFYPINIVKHNDYECDDVIGYLADKHKADSDVTIISSDTDFIQCIEDNVHLYNPVRKKFIEKPEYDYVLWKSLKGDASDNIDGFVGIGDKKAKKLCTNPEALEKFLLEEGRQDKLNRNLEMIRLHDLTEDVSGILHYPKLHVEKWQELKDLFTSYDFSSMVSKETSWNKYTNTFNQLFQEKQ